ncbi:LysR family transcriptional regulator [Pseudovibrio sp. POLY-S9]|uniref:LysR family transcriptional regulator n=1 Tax=Pseudovibrio sp. POLY-S9 TaxID=1576596 RepID=UPI00070E2AD0|nr:LysR family transcriptional regulator [Pseudovibrio sp. POLY-S9]
MDSITRIRCFLQVVESGGFSAAARDMGRSKALISKYVSELEDELGVRLLNRTTRQISLTQVGEAYFREAGELLQRFDDLKDAVQQDHREVRGRLRLSAPRSFSEATLGRVLASFLQEHPRVELDIEMEDRFVDIVEEGYDVAIRVAELEDSSLIARKIRDVRVVVCASPAYWEAHGMPEKASDLANMPCIIDTNYKHKTNWMFLANGERFSVPVKGPMHVNSAKTAVAAALAGLGVVRLPIFYVLEELMAGTLIPALEDYEVPGPAMYAVYPHRRHLSAKVRAFVDYMVNWHKQLEQHGDCPKMLDGPLPKES